MFHFGVKQKYDTALRHSEGTILCNAVYEELRKIRLVIYWFSEGSCV